MAEVRSKAVLADGTVVESFETHADLVDVTPMAVPWMGWKWVCPRGHVVRWEYGPPGHSDDVTLVGAKTHHRPERYYDEWTPSTYYTCGSCSSRKRVDFTYAYRSNSQRKYVAGVTWYQLNGETVSKERGEEVIAALARRAEAIYAKRA